MLKIHHKILVFLLPVVLLSGAKQAFSYDYNQSKVMSAKWASDIGQGVYAQKGIRAGSVVFKPSIDIAELYDSNIYRQAQNEVDDFVTIVRPSFDVMTQWDLHQIRAGISAENVYYADNNSEDYSDYSYYLSGRYDLAHKTYVSASMNKQKRHEDRGSLEDVNGDQPIEYDVTSYDLGFTRELGLIKFYLSGLTRAYEYDDSTRSGVFIDNSARDFRETLGSVRVAYGLSDDLDIYVQGDYDRRRYDESSASFRDSNGLAGYVGFHANVTGKIEASAYGGWMVRDYDGATSEDISVAGFGGDILWSLNNVTSFDAGMERTLEETSLANVSGIVRTNAHAGMEHAFQENLLFDADVGLRHDQYQGSGQNSGRDNVMYKAETGIDYVLNDKVQAGVSYDYNYRDFESASGDYDTHQLMLSIRLQY